MTVLCWLGFHAPRRTEAVTVKANAWTTTGTNAVCGRCGKRSWVNWPCEVGIGESKAA